MKRWSSKVDMFSSPNGCWVWTASKDPCGYGRFGVKRVNRQAHRVGYELLRGPIPAGHETDHLCRNRACVNPMHLEAVSHQVNVQRAFAAGCVPANSRKTHCKWGHSLENALINKNGSRKCRTCNRIWCQNFSAKRRGESDN